MRILSIVTSSSGGIISNAHIKPVQDSLLPSTTNPESQNLSLTQFYKVISDANSKQATHNPLQPMYAVISDATPKTEYSADNVMGYSWYHSDITNEEAEAALSMATTNMFMVRRTEGGLVLSRTVKGWKCHTVIHHSAEGYQLQNNDEKFSNVPDLIMHYQQFPANGQKIGKELLGTALTLKYSGTRIL